MENLHNHLFCISTGEWGLMTAVDDDDDCEFLGILCLVINFG